MKIVLIDDEKFCNEVMETLLADVLPQASIVGIFERADVALYEIPKLEPDLVFVDINMPFINGFELLDRLAPFNFKVIFTTAYDSYAIKAFKYGAIDYLLKPISSEDLKVALAKALINFKNLKVQEHNIKKYKIAVSNDQGIAFKPLDQIVYCEQEGNKTVLYFNNAKPLVTNKNIDNLEALLSKYSFFRIHKNYLINMAYIDMYLKADGGYVKVGEYSLPVAQDKKAEFNEILAKSVL